MVESKIKICLQEVFKVLIENKKILIPCETIIKSWERVLIEWIKDDTMPLFVRKGAETRGTILENFLQRKIMTTDNTPAHWVFKNIVFEEKKFTKNDIKNLLQNNNFPIAFIKKKEEQNTLIGKMVADNDTRLNNKGWKLAHIEGIAMKRGKNVTLTNYKEHHKRFLSLTNIYLIDKQYSGLAETVLFNTIVKEHIAELNKRNLTMFSNLTP